MKKPLFSGISIPHDHGFVSIGESQISIMIEGKPSIQINRFTQFMNDLDVLLRDDSYHHRAAIEL